MMNRKFTAEQEQQICQEYLNGVRPTILARRWECHYISIFNILNRCQVKTRMYRNRPSPKKELRIIRAFQRGISVIDLAVKYKCGHGTIDNILKQNHVYRRPRTLANPPKDNFAKHYKVLPNGCWQWTGFIQKDGYVRFAVHYPRINGKRSKPKRYMAHHFSYELTHGKIPQGKHLHHVCHNRACVNPDHLQLTTKSEHPLLDENTITAKNAAKTHCKRGHPFTPDNTYINPKYGGRACRQCRCIYDKHHRAISMPKKAPRIQVGVGS